MRCAGRHSLFSALVCNASSRSRMRNRLREPKVDPLVGSGDLAESCLRKYVLGAEVLQVSISLDVPCTPREGVSHCADECLGGVTLPANGLDETKTQFDFSIVIWRPEEPDPANGSIVGASADRIKREDLVGLA